MSEYIPCVAVKDEEFGTVHGVYFEHQTTEIEEHCEAVAEAGLVPVKSETYVMY